MWHDILPYVAAGFLAQLIDGALGMAYGITASSLLLGFGLPPAAVSATVHAAECFSTGASAISHHAFKNVDKDLFKRLLIPGVLGAVIGAYVLTNIPGDTIKPYIAVYLMGMGVIIILKAFKQFPSQKITSHLVPLGFFGAFVDAIGGGGWGPIVASNLIARGAEVRKTVGSVNAVEFFVTLSASVTFFLTLGFAHVNVIIGLAIGGVLAAPLAAWACKVIPHRPFMIAVGVLVIVLSTYNFWRAIS
ncbi:MAG: sulfite exporter TauE/SafE family protein [Alphaproteobacteria bacterium]|nr:sulfite exporter TauE/SafE family protein [Alphaproteobacteria bacterium]